MRDVFKGPVVFYPLLFAAFPVLFLYAHNIEHLVTGQLWLPLGVSVAFALVLWAILTLILRSLAKGALAAAILMLLFFSYGRIYEALDNRDVFVPGHGHLLPAVLVAFGYCVYFISRAKRDFRMATRLLNIVAVVMLAMNLLPIASYQVGVARHTSDAAGMTQEQDAANPVDLSTLPDIYYIIPDEMARCDTMLEYYDYDNSEFVDFLTERGFFVAHESETDHKWTQQSFASSLNMERISRSTSRAVAYGMIANNKVADFLQSLGYSYIFIAYDDRMLEPEPRVEPDLYYNFYEATVRDGAVDDFARLLWNTTMLRPFYNYLFGTQFETFWRHGALRTLERLKKMPEIEGPKFVLAHVFPPHTPFVFGPDGESVAPRNWYNWDDKQFYLGQYIFTARQLEEVVEVLLEESATPPIIIIQTDHGIRQMHLTEIAEEEWRKIFNAYYLPEGGTEQLWSSISPHNSFRLIFNYYFGADYEILED